MFRKVDGKEQQRDGCFVVEGEGLGGANASGVGGAVHSQLGQGPQGTRHSGMGMLIFNF